MDHAICINQNSFPAESYREGMELFRDALNGVLELLNESDRCTFYLDSNAGSLFDFEIAEGLNYEQFISGCGDEDLQMFLLEVDDKSPALDFLSDEQIDEMTSYKFYVQNESMDTYLDVYSLTWAVSGVLLSIATLEKWANPEIRIARYDEHGRYVTEPPIVLKNISSRAHGCQHHIVLGEVVLSDLIEPHIISSNLNDWFQSQTLENKTRVIDKLNQARQRNFQGGLPLFDSLSESDGLREIRISAYPGGAIRILFKHIGENKQALLVGFIKKSDGGGYARAIDEAKRLYGLIP